MASSSSFHFLSLAVMVIAGNLVLGNHGVSAQCEDKIPDLISQCYQYVSRPAAPETPSQGCCNVLKSVYIPCICRFVTPDVERLISMEKVVSVARSCGVTVRAGLQCGSYTVPPSV